MVPEMVKQGYSKPFSYGLIAASGILGILSPPSIPMVMFGVATNTSTSAMFMGGFGPGILSALLLIVATLYISKKRGYKGNEQKNINWKKVWRSLTEGVWALFVPIIILGGIYGGIFTPTEAAAIAVIYGFFVGKYIYRELTFKKINTCLIESAVTTSTILIIVGTATTLARILTLENIPFLVQKYLLNLSDNRWVIILAINLILLLTGCFMDSIAAIMVLSPIFLPIVLKLGFDPIHFGLILVLNLGIGLITPPVGVNLFVASGIGEIDFIRLVVGVIPFLIALLVSLFFVTLIPGITTAIPRLMGFSLFYDIWL